MRFSCGSNEAATTTDICPCKDNRHMRPYRPGHPRAGSPKVEDGSVGSQDSPLDPNGIFESSCGIGNRYRGFHIHLHFTSSSSANSMSSV